MFGELGIPLATAPGPLFEQPEVRDLRALLATLFATRGYIARYFGGLGIEPRITFEANSVSAVLDAVRSAGGKELDLPATPDLIWRALGVA